MERVPPLISAESIAARVRELAGEIVAARRADPGDGFVVLVMLKGAFVFAADLVRALDEAGAAPPIDFMSVSSYGSGAESSGAVVLETKPRLEVAGKEVLLVDDILDTGRSLEAVSRWLREEGAARVRSCVLLDKPARRVVEIDADFRGFEVPDRFLVGYGLDHDERWRHLPYVGTLDLP